MRSQRAELVADTAIDLLADRGMRGLTHRAVDEAAGLPPGSTSNLARTRSALLELTLDRLTELEIAEYDSFLTLTGAGLEEGAETLADLAAKALWIQLTAGRRRTIARYELALEATRRPELRTAYDKVGALFREPGVAILTAAGSSDPLRHSRQIVAFTEGLVFDAVVGAGAEPTPDDLRRGLAELLRGMLIRPDPRP
ncbi:TetR/AcrR family transcriptional regulator [Rhizohabitans arisaemae]|uniref:TetR/AcrR family transcriptional regulator n=1 Tax=Rhizohabitans arisaemae TaxID=2720610 RepID=UPI0024B0EA91|nr:TetR/AcrR family transcriptional regulator [Rhizohabitans arisaemae]